MVILNKELPENCYVCDSLILTTIGSDYCEINKAAACRNKRPDDCPIKMSLMITEGTTNGDVIKALYPDIVEHRYTNELDSKTVDVEFHNGLYGTKAFSTQWWDAKYNGVK